MKISLAWLLDYLEIEKSALDVDDLVQRFNKTTAEIERVEHLRLPLHEVAAAIVLSTDANGTHVSIPEWNTEMALTARSDAQPEAVYLVRRTAGKTRWATPHDFFSEKEGLLPAFAIASDELAGDWKNRVEHEDIILDVDNKSLTHRPDMWGHYGFAREIAAFLGVNCKREAELVPTLPVDEFMSKSTTSQDFPFVIENAAPNGCSRFVGAYFSRVTIGPSDPHLALRLLRIGSRPLNNVVDITNYLLYETSQPVHAYDAESIAGKQITVRFAHADEKLTLLDESVIDLSTEDLVIADARGPVCLAGVKGGLGSGISPQTRSIFFESAHFDAGVVRKAALRHKTRTDSSARFEKTLDPNQTTFAIARFIRLGRLYGLNLAMSGNMVSVGKVATEKIITITHGFLEQRIGVTLQQRDIVQPLMRMGFHLDVRGSEDAAAGIVYRIRVPTFRASKDISIPEDIVEEIARHYGFDRIPPQLPIILKRPYSLHALFRRRAAKKFLAYGAGMTEQQNYAYLDQEFFDITGWAYHGIEMINPVSERHKTLAPSLVPGLFLNVQHNVVGHDRLNFFEYGRTWEPTTTAAIERSMLAGIWFVKRGQVDFYQCKQTITELFRVCGVSGVTWHQEKSPMLPWYQPYQTATLISDGQVRGHAGKIEPTFLQKFDVLPESDGFVFEIDAEWLTARRPGTWHIAPSPKYQGSDFDISCMIPRSLAVATIEQALQTCSPVVERVALIDFFERPEWKEQRSVAFRLWVRNLERTMTKEEIDAARTRAIEVISALGATLRG